MTMDTQTTAVRRASRLFSRKPMPRSSSRARLQELLSHADIVIDGDRPWDPRVRDERFNVSGGGIVDIFETVFRDNAEDLAIYKSSLPKKDPEGEITGDAKALYRKWRTWQMSDHSPLWVEIETDFSGPYLKQFAG